MSNTRIIEIPATRQIRSGKNNTMRKMRVAAYCRVSTEEEEQQGSFETQKLYYTEKNQLNLRMGTGRDLCRRRYLRHPYKKA